MGGNLLPLSEPQVAGMPTRRLGCKDGPMHAATLAVMLNSVVFWYVDLFRDAECGGFEAVQRVLPGLLG